jgi:DDE family transposase
VRALDILHTRLSSAFAFMHSARWNAVWLMVQAVIAGERLWLTALGRARPGCARRKHAIKAADRLLGNHHLAAEQTVVYRGLAAMIVAPQSHPIILVDTVEVRPRWFALVASVPFKGRSFIICAHVSRAQKPKKPILLRFLRSLRQILPPRCRPVFVSDAGFESPWFAAVESFGWDYVGRVRGTTRVFVDGQWVENQALHRRATNRAKNVGRAGFRWPPHERRVVLSKEPRTKHRRRRYRTGRIARKQMDHDYQRGAHEPWVLVTSLAARPSGVVAVFALRMRIEETFRDVKNLRWGWSLRHCGSRSRSRLETLLLIGAIALLVQQIVGCAAENLGLHREHQANTEYRRRVLSIFVLGGLILRSEVPKLTTRHLAKAFAEVRSCTREFSAVTT